MRLRISLRNTPATYIIFCASPAGRLARLINNAVPNGPKNVTALTLTNVCSLPMASHTSGKLFVPCASNIQHSLRTSAYSCHQVMHWHPCPCCVRSDTTR